LSNENANLRNTVNSLNGENSYLKNQISDLNSIINLKKQETLEKSQTINLASHISGSGSFTYSTPYAGYFIIDITATKPVYVEVYSPKYGCTVRCPKEGATTYWTFVAPVLPDSTWVMIYKQNWWEEATITFSIRYIY
jgi:hypothetical protein